MAQQTCKVAVTSRRACCTDWMLRCVSSGELPGRIAYPLQECEDLMNRGIAGTGEGFDAPAAGKAGGRFHNPSSAELRSSMLKVYAHAVL